MKIYDSVNKTEVEVDGTKGLIQLMKDGRQVDLYLKEKKSDEDGYMSWDVEHWSSVDGKRFIRCYSLEGRVLGESTGHNIYDLENDFPAVFYFCGYIGFGLYMVFLALFVVMIFWAFGQDVAAAWRAQKDKGRPKPVRALCAFGGGVQRFLTVEMV